jgi:hypothetical protein
MMLKIKCKITLQKLKSLISRPKARDDILAQLAPFFPLDEGALLFFLQNAVPSVKAKELWAYDQALMSQFILKAEKMNAAELTALLLCASIYDYPFVKDCAAKRLVTLFEKEFFKNGLHHSSSPQHHLFLTECFAIAQLLYADDALKAALLKMLSVLKHLQTPNQTLSPLVETPLQYAFKDLQTDAARLDFLWARFRPLISVYKQEDSGIIIEKPKNHMMLSHNNTAASSLNTLIWRGQDIFLKSIRLNPMTIAQKNHLPLHHHVYDKNNVIVIDAAALKGDILERRIILFFKDTDHILIITLIQSQREHPYEMIISFDKKADLKNVFFSDDSSVNLASDQDHIIRRSASIGYNFSSVHLGEKFNMTFDKGYIFINHLKLDFQAIPARFVD